MRFVEHCRPSFDEVAVRLAVARAEAQYLSVYVNFMEQAKQGRLAKRTPLTRENIHQVKILLQEPEPWILTRADKEGMRPCMACSFEIEGLYQMPDTGKAKLVKELLKENIQGASTIAKH